MQKTLIGCLLVAFVALVVAVILAVVSGVAIYNHLVGLSQGVDAQWAQVENVYQRRNDLIPNLVNTVSGSANFEKSTLTEITNARASVGQVKVDPNTAPTDPQKLAEFQQAQERLGGALSRLLVVVERYPDLKSTTNFRDLQAEIEGTENRIAEQRRQFNEITRSYDTAVKSFPTVFFARMLGFQPKPYFQATAGSEVPPKVNFDFSGATPAPAH